MNDIGAWYTEQREKANKLSEELKKAKAEGASEEEIKKIERRLEQARYVGD